MAAIERQPVDEVFLSLDPELAAEELVLGLRLLEPPPRVIGVGAWDDLTARVASWRLDAIAIGENHAPAFLDATPRGHVCGNELAGLSSLGRGGLSAVAAGLAHAFGAAGVCLWIASED